MKAIRFWERDRTNFPGVVIPLAPSPPRPDRDTDSPTLPPLYFQTHANTDKDKEAGRSLNSDPEKDPEQTAPSSLSSSECAPLTLDELKAEVFNDHTSDPNGSPSAAYDSMSLAVYDDTSSDI